MRIYITWIVILAICLLCILNTSEGSDSIMQQQNLLKKGDSNVSLDNNGDSLSFLDILERAPSQSSEYAIHSSQSQEQQESANKNNHLASHVDTTQIGNGNEEPLAEASNPGDKFSVNSLLNNRPLTYKAALSLEDKIKKNKEKKISPNKIFRSSSKKEDLKSQINKNLQKRTEVHRNIPKSPLPLVTTSNLREQDREYIKTSRDLSSSESISTLPEFNIKKRDLKFQVHKDISGTGSGESSKKDLHITKGTFTNRGSSSSE
ncbi:hypothetical protein ACR3K2_30690, partial [Cryptosporidium serpentis]